MLTSYFAVVDGKQIVLWGPIENAFSYRLATGYGDDFSLYSPIQYGSL